MSVDKKDNLDNKDSLEKIIDELCQRAYKLDVATAFIKGKHDIKDELEKMHEKVSQVYYGIENLRKDLERMKEQNIHIRKTSSMIEALDKKILHQLETVPPELIQDYQNANEKSYLSVGQSVSQNIFSSIISDCDVDLTNHLMTELKPPSYHNSNTEKQSIMKNCKRTLFHEPEVCPTIPLITVEEFNKVPKYIIGRQTLETINSLINTINQTLIAKYAILSLGKTGAQKKGEINLYLHYKKQEFDIREQNAEDYYRQTKTKIDKTKLNLITALRHCKRLREYRMKNELRYVIISN